MKINDALDGHLAIIIAAASRNWTHITSADKPEEMASTAGRENHTRKTPRSLVSGTSVPAIDRISTRCYTCMRALASVDVSKLTKRRLTTKRFYQQGASYMEEINFLLFPYIAH